MDIEVDRQDLAAQLDALNTQSPRGLDKWTPYKIAGLGTIILSLLSAFILLPNRLFEPEILTFTLTLGALGIWRFSWWGVHAIRAERYASTAWPRQRTAADACWANGWRPRHLHVQMTTYFEKPEITEQVITALLSQIQAENLSATVYVGTASAYDEQIISDIARRYARLDAEIVFIRQNQPGKRMAIGLVMREILRTLPDPNDVILFMDGDAVLGPDALRKSCSLFGSDPELQALTTDEEVICYGPTWMARWLRMRFAQRRLAMQSHALSEKVLTLTGRMSMFRARHICCEKFVRTIEADHLDHWLWGRFRFLSGDDKSSWYHLLTVGAKMTYVPDAMVYTVEVIEGSAKDRMVANLRRWSGNMLRNGSRAIALGPRLVGPFIWWCIVDQRIAMWTMLVGPITILLAFVFAPDLLLTLTIWVVFSRYVLCLWLYRYARTPDLSWPFFLYVNQVLNAAVKVMLVFRPNRQSWANRGNQTSGDREGLFKGVKIAFSQVQLAAALGTLVLLIVQLSGSI